MDDFEKQFQTDEVETRTAPFIDLDSSDDGWSFEGLAGVYDEETDLGEFTESVKRGAYRKAMAKGNVPMFYHHNSALPVLATTAGGTLSLSDDAKGLRVKATIAKHYVGEAVRELVQRGDIKGMSTGFIVGRGNSRLERRADKPHRSIIDFNALIDVSPTWEPAYKGTTAELRSLRALQIADDIEQVQQVLSGAAPQLENGASVKEPETEQQDEEQRSGAEADMAAAARTRRLQLLGIHLPSTPNDSKESHDA